MIQIKDATYKDVDSIVVIHQQAFPDFFLTTLGEDFLRLYYNCMCKSNGAVTLCAVEDGKVVGFSTTALKSAGFNTRLIKKDLLKFTGESLKLLFTKPMSLIRLVKNLTKKGAMVDDNGDYAELYSIGVSPICQGKGLGSLLLTETEIKVRQSGEARLSLTTDKNNNESAVAFYQRNGYRILYEFVAYPDREMYRFIKGL